MTDISNAQPDSRADTVMEPGEYAPRGGIDGDPVRPFQESPRGVIELLLQSGNVQHADCRAARGPATEHEVQSRIDGRQTQRRAWIAGRELGASRPPVPAVGTQDPVLDVVQ